MNDKVRFTEKHLSTALKNASLHHIQSFDYAMETCLPRICQNLLPQEIASPMETEASKNKGNTIQYPFKKMLIWFENFQLKYVHGNLTLF